MASESINVSDDEFLEIAIRQQLLTPEEAAKITQAAVDNDTSISALCIEKGVLRPVQVDVIHGLAEPDNLAPGYEAVDLLGYGGLGIVYRVRQPKLDRLVALKTIPLHRIENPSVIARFKQEAKAVGRLKHPNIVAAYDFGTHRDRLFLAMELVEGTDLDELIKSSGPLGEGTAWALAQQAAAGLSHAAQHNLVHRDIKPGNLLLTKPPAGYPLPAGVPLLKITDFGLVQLETPDVEGTRLTMGGTSLGTPHYMAPEQISDAHVDLRADIYALGATVFHMLVGEPPFVGTTIGQVLTAKLKGNQAWIDKLPQATSRETIELLKDMLAQDPADRIADYATLLDRINVVLKLPPTAHDNGSAETIIQLLQPETSLDLLLASSASKQLRKSRSLWLGGILVAALALAAGLFFTDSFRGSTAIPTSQLVPSGWERALFNGSDLSGWTAIRGAWGPTVDDMGGRILAGKGSIVHELPRYTDSADEPLKNFGVSWKIDLQSAEAAELHFAHQNVRDDKLPRSVLRVTNDGVVLGSKASKMAEFVATVSPCPLVAKAADAETSHYHELRLERHVNHWRVQLNGTPICSQNIRVEQPTAAIQLVVEGAQAYFADLYVFELTDK